MRTLPALFLALTLAPGASAQVTDVEINDRIEAYQEEMMRIYEESSDLFLPDMGAVLDAAREAMEGLDVATLTPEQLMTLSGSGLLGASDSTNAALRRCRVLMNSEDEAGARAALVHARLMIDDRADRPGSARYIARAVEVFFDHPSAGDVRQQAGMLYQDLEFGAEGSRQLREAVDTHREAMLRYARETAASEDISVMHWSAKMVVGLEAAGVEGADIDELRASVTDRLAALSAGDLDDSARYQVDAALDLLTRGAREASLVGNPMPTMSILWSSDDSVDAFEDYRGKVLVIDFWATWCGPCIASFPQVRDLRAKYSEDKVAIVGVTSLQGAHYPQGAPPVDTSDDPEREHELMAGFIADQNITWDVVFTRQDVFNPDYVIEGIPHVVIVDPSGVIRHRALHPMDPTKGAKIDAILEEFASER